MRGRMAPMKIALTVVPWCCPRSRRRTPIIREQVLCTSLMCSDHDSLLFMTNPRWRWCLTWGIGTPLMVTRCPVAFPMCRCSLFSALKSMPQLSAHSLKDHNEVPRQKIKNLRQNVVARNMMNKCAKFHKDSPSGKKLKFNLPSAIELSETAEFVYNFIEALCKWATLVAHLPTFPLNFLCAFHRSCLSTSSAPLCKKVITVSVERPTAWC